MSARRRKGLTLAETLWAMLLGAFWTVVGVSALALVLRGLGLM